MALHLKATGIDYTDFSDVGGGLTEMESELMDDYEEGIYAAAPGQGEVTLSQEQPYTKIGDVCHCRGYAHSNAHSTDTVDWGLSGFPFACRVVSYASSQWQQLDPTMGIASVIGVTLFMGTGQSALEGHWNIDDGDWVRLKYPEMGSTFHVGWQIAYFV